MKKTLRRLMEPILARQAKRLIERQQPVVVAVGGSVGKTTTRLAIAAVLRQHYGEQLLESVDNYNSEIGLPLAIFGQEVPARILNPFAWLRVLRRNQRLIRHYPYKCVVLEIGTDRPGDIAAFMCWLHPRIGVVTLVAPEHMANFADERAVAEEEFTLALGSETAVLNNASPLLHDLAKRHRLKVKWYSVESLGSLARLKEVTKWPPHIREALGAAGEVAALLEVPEAKIKAGIADFAGAPGRMQELAGLHDSVIIDDTYNSSPTAALAALATLRAKPAKRKLAVLGQMNELGSGSAEYHRQVGREADWVDLLVTIGKEANLYLGPAAVGAGLGVDQWRQFDSAAQAGEFLAGQVQAGDVVLVKGSQNGVFAEECTKRLLANPEDARRLVRQSSQWLARKGSSAR